MVEIDRRYELDEVAELRKKYSMTPYHEFKFIKSRPKLREAFMDRCGRLPIRIRAIAIDKSRLSSTDSLSIKRGDDFVIEGLTRLCLARSSHPIENDHLVVDAAKKNFLWILRKTLSTATSLHGQPRKLFKRFSGDDSSSSDGLQIADMIVGTIRRFVELNETDLFKRIESKMEVLILVP